MAPDETSEKNQDTASSKTDGWTIQKLLQWTTTHFTSKGIEPARLDTELLLARVLGCKRMDLYLNFEKPLKPEELKEFRDLVKRRSQREPVAYIIGEQEFYGRPFKVGSGVLIPRPETEHLIDEVLRWVKASSAESKSLSLLDVGTGSGCLAITLALEIPEALVTTVDVSKDAALFAQENIRLHNVDNRLNFVHKDFEVFGAESAQGRQSFDVVVSNPPYVSEESSSTLSSDVRDFEPQIALFGGQKGFEKILRWLPFWEVLLKDGGLLAFEIGFDQGPVMKQTFERLRGFSDFKIIKDYSGHDRIVTAVRRSKHTHG